jgi:uncharacterized membrane protein YgdD (TMEM256/DUF423 family)
LLGASGVALGAWHAHGLQSFLERHRSDPHEVARSMSNFEVAVRYQMLHAGALLITGLLALRTRSAWNGAAGALFTLGVALFSGLLYARALGGPLVLVHLVPLGGVALIAGWLALAVAGMRPMRDA